jgi:hypothetical protein
MDRLKARWMRRLESDAVACEYRIRAEQQSGNVLVSNSPESNTRRKTTERNGRPSLIRPPHRVKLSRVERVGSKL